ncbi:MAG: 1-deoxy-D-xylulose-5-phosphate reductoisomerase [Lachnospiraceae bacterium]|nr:1-deoxy-D-xylulose-5-phosphate reductoisomerase [Lachnospiraceae bacterium]
MKRLVLLGSTGSIGSQTLDIVREYAGEFSVTALAAASNTELMEKQVREFGPAYAVLWNEDAAAELKVRIGDLPTKVLSGMDGLLTIASLPDYDILLTAVVGMIGIRPTIAAIKARKTIALANKETLVCAGHIIMPLAKEYGSAILPVDSEHSAIFQSLNGEPKDRIEKIWLTCSGGPFRGKKREELLSVKAEDALKHPNWSMGKKITIDSASMVNKGLEVMEAKWLFGVDYDRIRVVIHPESVVHSMVEYVDGAVMAELGAPDMRLPIQYALFYPDRRPADASRPRADFCALGKLCFEEPDTETFRALPLAVRAGKTGGTMPTIFNAANEEAVAHFLAGRISFLRIVELIEEAMDAHVPVTDPDVDRILEAEKEARESVLKSIK